MTGDIARQVSPNAQTQPGNSHRNRNIGISAGAFVVVLAVVAAAFLVLNRGGSGDVLDVALQPIDQPGPGPFTPSVVTAKPAVLQEFAATQVAKANASSTAATKNVTGDSGRLYGVNVITPVADRDELIKHLSAQAAPRAAWASAMDVPESEISDVVETLTPVVLSHDTAFTVHNLINGEVSTYQAVLQTGTVVFIDDHGRPVVNAVSGDPLSPPKRAAIEGDVSFHGNQWDGFDEDSITAIESSKTELITITGVDLRNGDSATVGVGKAVTLDGYLVSDETGASVVSVDGRTTAQIVDRPLAAVYDDGDGGIVYQEVRTPSDGTVSDTYTSEVMRLRAGDAKPSALKTARSGHVLQLLDVDNYQGKMSALIAESVEPARSGDLPTLKSLWLIDLAKMSVISILPKSFLGLNVGEINSIRGSIGGDRGEILWGRPRRMGSFWSTFIDPDPQKGRSGPEEYCQAATSEVCIGYFGAVLTDGSFATIHSQTPTDGVVVNVGASQRDKKARTIRLNAFDADGAGYYVLENSDEALVASFVPDVGQESLGAPQQAVEIDTKTWKTTVLPITGHVIPIRAPIIRPREVQPTETPSSIPNTTNHPTTSMQATSPPPTAPPSTAPPTTTPTPPYRCGEVTTMSGGTVEVVVTEGSPPCTQAMDMFNRYYNDPEVAARMQGSGAYVDIDGWDCISDSAVGTEQSGKASTCTNGGAKIGTYEIGRGPLG